MPIWRLSGEGLSLAGPVYIYAVEECSVVVGIISYRGKSRNNFHQIHICGNKIIKFSFEYLVAIAVLVAEKVETVHNVPGDQKLHGKSCSHTNGKNNRKN